MFINILAKSAEGIVCTAGTQTITIPTQLANVVSLIYHAIQIGVPLLLIIFGMLDLGKAVMAQKEDEIKKGQQTFIKRLIAAAIVFFVFVIVQLVVNLIGGDDNIMACVSAILK